MKKLLSIMAMVAVIFATSCQRVEDPTGLGTTSEVTFSVQSPDQLTRAIGDGSEAKNLIVAVYDKKGDYLEKVSPKSPITGSKHWDVTLSLVDGMVYDIVFWAQADGAPYSLNQNEKTLTVNYENAKAQDEKRDAFYAVVKDYEADGANTVAVKLTRPFAQLNIVTTDYTTAANSGVNVTTTGLKVSNLPTTMNLLSGGVSGSAEAVVFSAANKPVESHPSFTNTGDVEYTWLSMNYVLASEEGDLISTVTLTGTTKEKDYRDIPVKRNFRTNIYGKILTSDVDFDVDTDQEFDDDEDIQHIAQGIYLNEDGQYVITEAAGLRFVANMANEGVGTKATDSFKSMFEGKTIILSSNIDLAGEEWTPMDLWGCTSLTIDGAEHKISNMVIKGEGHLGFISQCTGNINIKDLTFENPIVEGTASFIGVVIGYQYGVATFDNVDVHGGVVSTNIANKGIRIGGLIGFSPKDNGSDGFNLKKCDVIETEIRGYHNVSGLVGTALVEGKSFMSDCSVTNCKFYFSGDYEEPENGNCGYHVYDSNGYSVGFSVKENCTESENQAFYVKISSEDADYGESDKVVYVNNPENLPKVLKNPDTHTIMLGAGEFVADIYNETGTPKRESLTIIGSEGTKVSFANQQVRMELFTNFKIENCEIMRMATKSWGHIVFGSSKNANGVYTIENCTFKGVGTQGIYINETVSGATYNILNCTFNGDFGSEGAITIQTNKDVDHTINIIGCEFNNIPDTSHKIFLAPSKNGLFYDFTLNTDLQVSSDAEIIDLIKLGVESINLSAGDYVMPAGSSINLQNKKLTFKGTKETVIDVSKIDARDQFVTGATLAFEGVTLNFSKNIYMGFANPVGLTYKGCDINGLQCLYGPVSFQDCNLNSNGAEHSVWTYGSNNVSFKGCNFAYGDRCVNVYIDNGNGSVDVAFDGCKFDTSNTASVGAVEINSSVFPQGANVAFNGCTAPANGHMVFISKWDPTKGNTANVMVNGESFSAPVQQ